MMVGEACAKCTRRCLLFHGTGKDSTTPYSFFKIMFGDRFSNALFFPPTVAPFVSPLVNKEVNLEDRSGRQWKSRVSYTQDCYALQEGWNLFLSDHGVELGDFLVFHYVREAHFLVEFYECRTVCQKLDFSEYSNGIPVASKRAKVSAGKVGASTSTGAGRGNVNGYGKGRGAEGSHLPPGRIIGKFLNAPELPTSRVDNQCKGKQAIELKSATSSEKIGTKESSGVSRMKSICTGKNNTKGSMDVPVDRQCKGNSEAGSDGKALVQNKPTCIIDLDGPKLKTIEANFQYGEICKHSDASKNTAFPHPVTSLKPKAATDSETSIRGRNVVLQGCGLPHALRTKQPGKEPVVIDLEQLPVPNYPIGDRSNAPVAKKREARKMVMDMEQLQVPNSPTGDRSNAPRAKKREANEMVIDLEQLQVSNLPIGDRINAPGAKKQEATEMVDMEQLRVPNLPTGDRSNAPGVKKREATKMVVDLEQLKVSNLPIGDRSNAPRAMKQKTTKMMMDLEQLQVSNSTIGDHSNAPQAKKLEAAKIEDTEQLQVPDMPVGDRSNIPRAKKLGATKMGPKGTREELPIVLSRTEDSAAMKHEIVMVEDYPAPAEARFTCCITTQQPFLELPELLTGLFKKRRGRQLTFSNMFVLLRDPEMRLWPVFYHEEKEYNVKLFASGWESFSRANSIRTGDKCVFGVECKVNANAILQVRIVRKAATLQLEPRPGLQFGVLTRSFTS